VIKNASGLTTAAILDGFVITRGNANWQEVGYIDFDSYGGGVLNDGDRSDVGCSPTFRNCSFLNNTAILGGAMYNEAYFGKSSPNSDQLLISE